ncbi:UDP-glycosyltransferase UGT5-like [Bacillus rossius redtenbacheri]|uniref:UDP-glycosyltransferase UGT5-like n=1 Tax=Bacillus rossius redtenbacheri TaxID=93214 RepID=UPI002FDE1190
MELLVKIIFSIALCFAQSLSPATGYRILGVFPHTAKSHFIMSGAIMRGLAERGHEVVVISPFPEKVAPKNYKDITLLKEEDTIVNAFGIDSFDGKGIVNIYRLLYDIAAQMCEYTYSSPKVKELLGSDERFDLVIVEIFNTDCFLAFAHRFNASVVGISSSAMLPWTSERFGNPDNPSYVPVIVTDHHDRMSLAERLANAAILWSSNLMYRWLFNAKANQVVRRHFGELAPTVEEMASRMSLFVVNSHPALHQSRPLVPAVVEVGGLHVKEPRAIPQEIERFLNESEHGVIYFSLGSTVRSDSFPEEMRKAFLDVFSELPQRVLWKWESGSMPGRPGNVRVSKWMPQLEILSHPNVKAFVTHGGLMGTMEAAYFGVPMVAIPLFGDQFFNVRSYVEKGIAVKLDYGAINKNTVMTALKTVLENSSYAENAKRISRILRDGPMSPLDTAMFWIEYVVRHGGAPHLRSAAADLAWYQYLLLDVAAVLLLGFAVVSTLLFLLLRSAARRFSPGIRKHASSKQTMKLKSK